MTVYVRFAPKADKWTDVSVRRLCANRAGRGSDKVSPRESLERSPGVSWGFAQGCN
jgi:hypothetical protein